MLNSKCIKAESVLPPLVRDAMAQTDRLIQKTKSCQTKKSEGIDIEIQTEIKTDTITTGIQTIQENQEIATPNRPASSRSKPSKKRKLLPPQTDKQSRQENRPKETKSDILSEKGEDFDVGQVVWVWLASYPLWPGMIAPAPEQDPDHGKY